MCWRSGSSCPSASRRGTVHVLARDGSISFLDLDTQSVTLRRAVDPPAGATAKAIRAVERHGGWNYTLLWDDGSLSLVEVTSSPQFDALGSRTTKYDVRSGGESVQEGSVRPVLALMRGSEEDSTAVRLLPGGQIAVARLVRSENLLGEQETKSETHVIDAAALDPITAMTASGDGRTLYAGNGSGRIARWQLDDEGAMRSQEIVLAFPDRRRDNAGHGLWRCIVGGGRRPRRGDDVVHSPRRRANLHSRGSIHWPSTKARSARSSHPPATRPSGASARTANCIGII